MPVNFGGVALTVQPDVAPDVAMRALQGQGLPEVVRFSAEEALGETAATEINSEAWRDVATALVADPALAHGQHTFWLTTSEDLASAYAGDGQAQLQPLARELAAMEKTDEPTALKKILGVLKEHAPQYYESTEVA